MAYEPQNVTHPLYLSVTKQNIENALIFRKIDGI